MYIHAMQYPWGPEKGPLELELQTCIARGELGTESRPSEGAVGLFLQALETNFLGLLLALILSLHFSVQPLN